MKHCLLLSGFPWLSLVTRVCIVGTKLFGLQPGAESSVLMWKNGDTPYIRWHVFGRCCPTEDKLVSREQRMTISLWVVTVLPSALVSVTIKTGSHSPLVKRMWLNSTV